MANLTILADTHERPERHAHCRVQDDGVPVLHVEPIRARLRQLRVVVQELEQDSDEVVTPRPEIQHCGHEQKQKRKFGQKERLNVRAFFFVKKKTSVISKKKKKVPRENLSPLRFKLIRTILSRIELRFLTF